MAERRMTKRIEGNTIIFTVGEEELSYNTDFLPAEIKNYLIPFGVGHKLGDSANLAKSEEEIKTCIQKTWDSLMAGNWSVRGEAKTKEPKISKKTILENIEKLPENERDMAKALLAQMGFEL